MSSSIENETQAPASAIGALADLIHLDAHRSLVAPSLAVAAVIVALATQFAISEHQDIPYVGLGFLVAAALLGGAMVADARWRRLASRETEHPEFVLPFRWEMGLAAVAIAVAAFFRFYHFNSFPQGLWYDEGVNATDAISLIEKDHFRLWFETVMGRSTLYLYLLALSLRVFGYSIFAVRLVPALAGLAAVVAFYFLARRIVEPVPALVATALLAASRWATTFSRISWEASIQPVLEIVAVYFFIKAIDTGKRAYFALAGFVLALGLYSYVAFRMVPVVMLVFLGLLAATRWRLLWKNIRGLILYAVVFSVALAPLALFTLQHQDKVLKRTREVSVFREVDKENSYDPLWHNFRATWRMFNVKGDGNGRHNLPFAPMVDDVTASLLMLGLAASVFSIRNWKRGAIAPWFLLALVPGALTLQIENPSGIRGIGAIPPLYLLIGLAASSVYRVLAPTRAGLVLFGVGATLLVGGSIVTNYDDLFNRQEGDLRVYDAFTPEFTQAAQIVHDNEGSKDVYLSRQWTGHPALGLLADPKKFRAYTASIDVVFPASDKDVLLIADNRQFGMLQTLQRLYPDLRREDHTDPFGRIFYSKVTIPASDTKALHQLSLTVHRGTDASSPVVSSARTTVDRDWSQSEIDAAGGTITAVWDGYIWITNTPGTVALKFDAPGIAAIDVDEKQVASGGNSASMMPTPLTLGEHHVRLTAIISQPGHSALTPTGPLPEGAAPTDLLYGLSAGDTGFQVIYHSGRDEAGTPTMVTHFPFAVASEMLPSAQAVEYRGTYTAAAEGDYSFALDGATSTQLIIDDQLVVDNGGAHPPRRLEGTAHLTAGPHLVDIQFVVGGIPDWSLEIKAPDTDWKLADGSEFQPITTPFTQPAGVTLSVDPQQPNGAKIEGVEAPEAVAILTDGTVVVGGGNVLTFLDRGGATKRTVRLAEGVAISDLASTADGRLLVADRQSHSVLVLDGDGNQAAQIGPFATVVGIASAGTKGYVASPSGGILYQFDLTQGSAPTVLPVSGPDSKVRAIQPSDIAVLPDGTFFVTDFERRAIIISSDGIQGRSVAGVGGTGLQVPHLAALGNLVLLSDPNNERIIAYDEKGKQRGVYAFPPKTGGTRPVGIAASPDGVIYVADMNGLLYRLKIEIPPEAASELHIQ